MININIVGNDHESMEPLTFALLHLLLMAKLTEEEYAQVKVLRHTRGRETCAPAFGFVQTLLHNWISAKERKTFLSSPFKTLVVWRDKIPLRDCAHPQEKMQDAVWTIITDVDEEPGTDTDDYYLFESVQECTEILTQGSSKRIVALIDSIVETLVSEVVLRRAAWFAMEQAVQPTDSNIDTGEGQVLDLVQVMDLNYGPDVEALPEVIRLAALDLFPGKHLNEWNKWLFGRLIVGIHASLPEVAEMLEYRKTLIAETASLDHNEK